MGSDAREDGHEGEDGELHSDGDGLVLKVSEPFPIQ